MAKLHILTVPDPRLRIKAKPVDVVDDRIRQILDDMLETMYADHGCGLAATQVNIPLRLVVIDLSYDNETCPIYKMVNPEIIWKSDDTIIHEERCLSVPEQRAPVSRPSAIKLKYLDENGNPCEIETDDFLATCVQHEIDHLDGKLYIDYLSPLKRNMIINKVKRLNRVSKDNE